MTDIFVFGSNLAGIHGAGAALHAKKFYLARSGVGEGRTGNAYALPTKDASLRTLPLFKIGAALLRLSEYARNHPNDTFLLTPVGCGLAGYRASQIKPWVEAANMPSNVNLTPSWSDHND
jgi:hypothetical protein